VPLTFARPRFSHARSIDDAGVDRASSKPAHALLLTVRQAPGGGVVQVTRVVYDGVGMWCSSAATRARDVTPLRLARVPRMEHAGAGPASLSRGLDQGAARGEFGPRGPPRPHRGDWPSRTDVGLLPRSCRLPPSWDRSEPFLATFMGPPRLPWDHRRVVRRRAAARPLPIRSGRVIWRSRVAFREVAVIEIREAALLAGRAGAAHGG
jgi:hypothetical protein